jgi:PKD repeat protein
MLACRVTMLVILMLLVSSCGGERKQSFSEPAAGSTQHTLSASLAELEALMPPQGADQAVFAQIKSALRIALIARGEGKFVSAPPEGDANRVNNLALVDIGGGNYALLWHYRNLGDYSQDGIVSVADITPLAMHYSQEWVTGEENTLPAVVDGSGNKKVDIADVTPIAMNFLSECAGYVVEGSADGTNFSEIVEVPFSVGSPPGRLSFAYDLIAPVSIYYRVRPFDSEGDRGPESNTTAIPQPPVAAFTAIPASGNAPITVDFDATTSTDPDGTIVLYEWDWDSDGTYDVSGTSTTVQHTYDVTGSYNAALRVTDDDGFMDTEVVTVTAIGEMWSHSWGGSALEFCSGTVVDETGNVIVAGRILNLSTGMEDSALLKYDANGDLLWQKTWGGVGDDVCSGVGVDGEGNIYVAGHTQSFSGGISDAFVLKYDSSGSLLWQTTWGGSDWDYVYGFAVDDSGQAYITGETWSFEGNGEAFLVKFDAGGAIVWQKIWGGSDYDYGYGVAVSGNGNVFVTGETASYSVGVSDVFTLAYDSSGNLLWQKTWGESNDDRGYAVASDASGQAFVTGETYSFGTGSTEIFLLKYDASGNLLWQKTWGGSGTEGGTGIAVDGLGQIYVTGDTYTYGAGAMLSCSSTIPVGT